MTTRPSQLSPCQKSSRAAFAAELLVLAAVCGFGVLLGTGPDGDLDDRTQAVEVLAFAAGIAATILLAVAAWLSGSGRAVRIALAVGCFAAAYLSFRAVEMNAPLARDVALIAVVTILGSTLRSADALLRGRRAVLALTILLVAASAVLALAPSAILGAPVDTVVGIATAAVAGTVSAGLVLAGLRRGKPLLRRVGLAFVLVTGAQLAVLLPTVPTTFEIAAVLEFAAVGVLLLSAAHFTLDAVTAVWREQEESQSMLAEAEATAETARARDHEIRNLVLGLSGAAAVLARGGSATTDTGRLRAATRSEIERLRRLVDVVPAVLRMPDTDVTPLLRDLAALHRSSGHDVRVLAADGLRTRMDAGALSQVVTNCLVNCARHAPGARVVMRAWRSSGRIVVEVSDDGPGLPFGVGDELLARGARGTSSGGQGLGLHISSDLVRRGGGTVRLRSGRGAGCTVVIELAPAVSATPEESVTV